MTVAIASSQRVETEQKRIRRRVGIIWALLFFNVLGDSASPVLHIPHKIAQVLTQGALPAAFILALTINPKTKLRPNLFLGLYSVIAAMTIMMSVRFISLGTVYRSFRLAGFVAVLWLLTPWFGRRDLLILRSHIRVLIVLVGSVLVGFAIAPHKAREGGRLSGVLWPIPATQVAHYAAELTGLAIVLWLCHLITRRRMALIVIPASVVLLISHTRTAILAAVLGLLVAGLSLLTANRRVRRIFVAMIVVGGIAALGPSALLTSWLERGQSSQQLHSLTGRTKSWGTVLSNHRPETNKLFGSGLSNGSVYYQSNPALDGPAIDSSWIATYQDQGFVGDVLDATILLALLLAALPRAPGPAKAMACFIVVYCLAAAFTETGLGEASPYLLDLAVAASLLAIPARVETRGDGLQLARAGPGYRESQQWSLPAALELQDHFRQASVGAARFATGPVRLGRISPTRPGILAGVGLSLRRLVPARIARLGSRFGANSASAKTAGLTMADQCFASVSNFVIGVVVARIAGPSGLGAFAFAYAAWIMLTNIHRALITDPMAILGDARAEDAVERIRRGFAAEIALGLAATAVLVLVGVILLFVGLRTFGLALLALVPWVTFLNLQDYWRWIGFMQGRPGKSLANDAMFDLAMAIALVFVVVSGQHSVFAIVSAWGLGAVAGAVFGLWQFGIRPGFRGGVGLLRARWNLSKWLVASSATSWGSSQLYLIIPGIILGPAALGGLKAAQGLVTGPSGPLIQASSSFGLPEGSKALSEKGWPGLAQISRFVTLIGFASVAAVSLAIFVAGGRLLGLSYGARFSHYQATAVILTIGMLLNALGMGAALSLKVLKRTQSLFSVQVIMLAVSIPAAAILSVLYGLSGAAFASLLTSLAGLAAFLFYRNRARRSLEQEAAIPAEGQVELVGDRAP
jgi:O-antigen/teichoic acid export membrane protein